jgi:hypothetical protein
VLPSVGADADDDIESRGSSEWIRIVVADSQRDKTLSSVLPCRCCSVPCYASDLVVLQSRPPLLGFTTHHLPRTGPCHCPTHTRSLAQFRLARPIHTLSLRSTPLPLPLPLPLARSGRSPHSHSLAPVARPSHTRLLARSARSRLNSSQTCPSKTRGAAPPRNPPTVFLPPSSPPGSTTLPLPHS